MPVTKKSITFAVPYCVTHLAFSNFSTKRKIGTPFCAEVQTEEKLWCLKRLRRAENSVYNNDKDNKMNTEYRETYSLPFRQRSMAFSCL